MRFIDAVEYQGFWGSFWDLIWWFLVAFIFITYLFVLFAIIGDLFRDHKLNGWLKAVWRQSDTGREAKFYALTRKGQKQLATVRASWQRLAVTVELIFSEGE